ncbi:MAG: MFS transporter [Proteobacteria bacterium]|nr:MFS transporter [Pseudomonadota bacterium]MBU1581417.1 MFS transporter [Pseudomonadota bacterium]MBU2631786.1 MFS transporter [Pseudomonadota bacterium]
MPAKTGGPSPFSIPNIRLFIAFKVFFNSRFYYPIFTILFLDFGLTVAQFSILNAVWAATIVLAEVPSGALADIIGRKRLLVFATLTMIVEIGIISFVPKSDPSIIFIVFLVNRVLSGLAEAAASGADEAIAYDSLAAQGNPDQWGRVLEVLMRFQSIGFIIAMSIGAAVYDPDLLETICRFLGFAVTFTQETTMRFPLYLTFLLAICACIATLGMKDPKTGASSSGFDTKQIRQAFDLTLKAGLWIFKTPFALTVILFGMLFDGIIRMVITLSSQYYRMIELPESLFGIIGALVAMLGLVIPKIANKLAEKKSPSYALGITASLTLSGLVTMSFFWPYSGLIPALITFSAMYFTGFFVSFYINRITSSDLRATVLSFKGLAYNISYGVLGILYALVLKTKKQGIHPSPDVENIVFMDSFSWFPMTFTAWFVLLLALYFFRLKKPSPSQPHA